MQFQHYKIKSILDQNEYHSVSFSDDLMLFSTLRHQDLKTLKTKSREKTAISVI